MNSATTDAKEVFESAILRKDPAERRAWVEASCAGNEALKKEVESLIAAFDKAGSFMQNTPTLELPRLPTQGERGRRFGNYELLEEIARGGMGVVYKARQVGLNRVVAVKMILAGQFAGEAEVKRFHTEARAAASLQHPNIVGIHEVGEHEGCHYYSMPYLEGRSLADKVHSGEWRAGDGSDAARLVAKIARAVQYAHDSGILHRDLKPGNILVGPDGEPRITDFGLAKRISAETHLTLTGNVMGTPGFMAPEQARGQSRQCTTATDIYSLGAVLYYLLTGRPPFVADSALDALLLVLEGEAVLPRRINPRVPGPLERICLRCLEKRPENRYASAGQLADSLERFLKGEALDDQTQAIAPRVAAWARRQPALVARLVTVLLCLGIVETAYRLHEYTTPPRHWGVVVALVLWLVVSSLCQWGLKSERHSHWIRPVWSGVDPAVLTAILYISQGFHSPLVLLYPTLIAASGFWLRVPLVATATALSLIGYCLLLLDASYRQPATIPSHWHLLAAVGILVTGLSIAYLVNRVSALTQFYQHRSGD